MRDAGHDGGSVNQNLLYFALGMREEREASYSDVLPLEDGDAFCSAPTVSGMRCRLRISNRACGW